MPTMVQLKELRLIHLCIAITFFTSGLIINIIQLVLYLTLKTVNKRAFRKVMYYLCYSMYSQLIFVTDWYSNSTLKVYMDEDDENIYAGKENVLLMMNHAYEIDWLVGWMVAEKLKVLGNCKAYAKKVISYVPIIGWAWKFAEFVFLERSFDKDKEIIAKQLREIFAYPDPVWLLLNAEGTRFTSKKHEASIKFAEDRGIPVLKHHLIPRTKGFTASLQSLRGRCPAVYDINLAFKRGSRVPPTIYSLLNGHSVEGFMFIRRIPLDTIPNDEERAAEWLQNLFREKDRIQESFHITESFFELSGFKETAHKYYKRRVCCLLNFLVWSCFSISVITHYLISSLINHNWIGLSIALGILMTFYVLMEKAIGMSKISKASSYGT